MPARNFGVVWAETRWLRYLLYICVSTQLNYILVKAKGRFIKTNGQLLPKFYYEENLNCFRTKNRNLFYLKVVISYIIIII